MTSKRQRQQRNAARTASNEVLKKRRLEVSAQSKLDDDKLSTTDTSNTKGEEIWFWNKSANETNSDKEGERDDVDMEDVEESRTEQAVSPEVCKT